MWYHHGVAVALSRVLKAMGNDVRRCVPSFALRMLKLPQRVQTRCKPEGLGFAAKLLKGRGYGANCNPYFPPVASDVARVCSPHTK
jgi:hypothetical protein